MNDKQQDKVETTDAEPSPVAERETLRSRNRTPLANGPSESKAPAGTWSMRLAVILLGVLILLIVAGRILRAV